MMIATTEHLARVSSLCTTAKKLFENGQRSIKQKQALFNALGDFTGITGGFNSITGKTIGLQIEHEVGNYPGRNGNRCNGCNGEIDQGGFCPGQTDHWNKKPGQCGKVVEEKMNIFDQTSILDQLREDIMVKIRKTQNQEAVAKVTQALQDFKDNKTPKNRSPKSPGLITPNRCGRCGGMIPEGDSVCGTCQTDHATP